MKKRSIKMWLFLGIILTLISLCPLQAAVTGMSSDFELEDLWEDTPMTKDLPHVWRIYRRFQNPSKLHTQLRLYMVRPKEWQPGDQRPAIVFVHGGGWENGDPDQWFPQCRYFALRNMVAASVQYRRKTKTVGVDESIADCKSAIRYMRKHAAELGIDPQRIAVVGESAGGHLVGALGTIDEFNHLEDDLSYSALPDTMILLNPITDLTTKWGRGFGDKAMAFSPLHHISEKTPPTLLIHGSSDNGVDMMKHSKAFCDRVNALGQSHSKLIVFEGAGHAFSVFKYGPDGYVKRAILEIDKYLVERGWLPGV